MVPDTKIVKIVGPKAYKLYYFATFIHTYCPISYTSFVKGRKMKMKKTAGIAVIALMFVFIYGCLEHTPSAPVVNTKITAEYNFTLWGIGTIRQIKQYAKDKDVYKLTTMNMDRTVTGTQALTKQEFEQAVFVSARGTGYTEIDAAAYSAEYPAAEKCWIDALTVNTFCGNSSGVNVYDGNARNRIGYADADDYSALTSYSETY